MIGGFTQTKLPSAQKMVWLAQDIPIADDYFEYILEKFEKELSTETVDNPDDGTLQG